MYMFDEHQQETIARMRVILELFIVSGILNCATRVLSLYILQCHVGDVATAALYVRAALPPIVQSAWGHFYNVEGRV